MPGETVPCPRANTQMRISSASFKSKPLGSTVGAVWSPSFGVPFGAWNPVLEGSQSVVGDSAPV
jgi:hypothetical protein